MCSIDLHIRIVKEILILVSTFLLLKMVAQLMMALALKRLQARAI